MLLLSTDVPHRSIKSCCLFARLPPYRSAISFGHRKMKFVTHLVLRSREEQQKQCRGRDPFGVNSACCWCTSLPKSTTLTPTTAQPIHPIPANAGHQSSNSSSRRTESIEEIELRDLSHLSPPSPAHSRAERESLEVHPRAHISSESWPSPPPKARTRL
jgi:hypothetical protein